MMHITVALPDDVAQEYYNASEKLKEVLEVGQPDPQTLMRSCSPASPPTTSPPLRPGFAEHYRRSHARGNRYLVFSTGFENAPNPNY